MNQFIFLLPLSILTTVSAQLCLKKGILGLGELDVSLTGFFSLIPKVLQNIWLLGGLFLFGISFLLWLFVLSKLQLNIAYPIFVGLNFCLITAFSWFLFKEHLSLLQILGIAVIIFGIFLVLPKGSM